MSEITNFEKQLMKHNRQTLTIGQRKSDVENPISHLDMQNSFKHKSSMEQHGHIKQY